MPTAAGTTGSPTTAGRPWATWCRAPGWPCRTCGLAPFAGIKLIDLLVSLVLGIGRAIAEEAGVDDFLAEATPEDKR
ncbi:hypothetical protein [Streptomyces sp. BK239]|uniref:hypothetical protein n=1 Tax=Streptomyces sp. BK239 TaxID=2512155 RepID=UPI00102B6C7D|nr:hypothetical protein [Streptomyces sp. BK239]